MPHATWLTTHSRHYEDSCKKCHDSYRGGISGDFRTWPGSSRQYTDNVMYYWQCNVLTTCSENIQTIHRKSTDSLLTVYWRSKDDLQKIYRKSMFALHLNCWYKGTLCLLQCIRNFYFVTLLGQLISFRSCHFELKGPGVLMPFCARVQKTRGGDGRCVNRVFVEF